MTRAGLALTMVAMPAIAASVPLVQPTRAETVALTNTARPGAAHPISGSRWLSWSARGHTASLTLIAGYHTVNNGFNFNGYATGKMTISVPVGAHVDVHFTNQGSLAHSAIVTAYRLRANTGPFAPAFRGASSTNPASGVMPGQSQTFTFFAAKTGTYALVCGVPGHAAAGMWDVLTVTAGGHPAIILH